MSRQRHPDDESHARDRPYEQRRRTDGVAPFVLLAVDCAECQPTNCQGHDDGSQPIEGPARVRVLAFLHVTPARPQGDGDQRHVQEEDGSPGDGVDEDATHHRAQDRSRGGCGGPQPEGAASLRAGESMREQRE